MGKLGWNSGYIGSDQRDTAVGAVSYGKFYLERLDGRFEPFLSYTGLLDTYSGSYIALSTRKLSAFYSGSALRVRRSLDNTEQDIGFSSTGDLNLSILTNFLQGSNGFITTWYDQSGNNRHFTQTTAVNQPPFEVSPSGLIKPSLNNTTSSFLSNSNISSLSGSYSVFIATKATAFGPAENYFLGTPSSLHLGWRNQNTPTIAHFSNDANYSYAGTTNPLLHTLIYKATGSQYWMNNSSIGSNATTPNAGITNRSILYLGTGYLTSQNFRGYIQEVIIYANDKTADVSNINTNINNYFNYY
jgi:hypothetical protein